MTLENLKATDNSILSRGLKRSYVGTSSKISRLFMKRKLLDRDELIKFRSFLNMKGKSLENKDKNNPTDSP